MEKLSKFVQVVKRACVTAWLEIGNSWLPSLSSYFLMLHFSLFLEGVHLACGQEEVCFFRNIFFSTFFILLFSTKLSSSGKSVCNAMGMKSHSAANLPEQYIGSERNTTLAKTVLFRQNHCPCVLKFD